MQIDIANWFEICATLIAAICWLSKPRKCTCVLAVMLLITVAIEFSSKFLYSQYLTSQSKFVLYLRFSLYSTIYNCITLSGNLAIFYYLLHDQKSKKQYVLICTLSIAFVLVNFLIGQGYKQFNNYSTVVCWMVLVAFTLYKLRTYNDLTFDKRANVLTLLFLLTVVTYYTINLPFFIFFHSMFTEEKKLGIQLYRAINDNANYLLYVSLSLFAILSVIKDKNQKILTQDASKPKLAI